MGTPTRTRTPTPTPIALSTHSIMSVPSDISELQRTYIVSLILTFILWVKFQVVIMKQGSVAFLADTRAPEDDSFGQKPKEVTDAAIALDRRWRRVVGNDMEQIPIGLIVLWGAGSCAAPVSRTTRRS